MTVASAVLDRVMKVQDVTDPARSTRSCQRCKGAQKITVKNAAGRKVEVDCPVCRRSGRDVLLTK